MLGLIKFILKYVPAKWWTNGIRGILSSACSFYLLNIAMDVNLIERYKAVFTQSNFFFFILFQIIVMLVFYVLLDFLLRIIFNKIIKKWIDKTHEEYKKESKREFLKSISEIKNVSLNFIMGYPVELGYIKRQEIFEIGNEIGKVEVTEQEKQEAIAEINAAIIKWACILIHLVLTLWIVYHYDKYLMISVLAGGFILTIFLVASIILIVKNIELIEILQRELKRRSIKK